MFVILSFQSSTIKQYAGISMVFVPVTSSVKSAYELFILYEIIPTVIRNNRQIIDNY